MWMAPTRSGRARLWRPRSTTPAVTELRVFSLGDGAAMAGILVAGRRDNSEATFLVFLLD
jgi:hypothetical protein